MTTLYSAKSTIDKDGQLAYRITKFVDGEVESSYLTDGHQCDCPAGVRPTCRHRQMLPQMIADDIINTHWFLDWDGGKAIVDFDGTMKSALDYLLTPPAGEALQGELGFNTEMQLALEADAEKLSAMTGEEHTVTFFDLVTPATPEPAPQTQPAWRRL